MNKKRDDVVYYEEWAYEKDTLPIERQLEIEARFAELITENLPEAPRAFLIANHTLACWRYNWSRIWFNVKYRLRWPRYCRTCSGWGVTRVGYDRETGHPNIDPCDACICGSGHYSLFSRYA